MSEAHVDSWYVASAGTPPDFPVLRGEQRSDVCVIGGGYSGLSTALHLRKHGFSVTLLEANRVGWGASGRNGGHVGTGQRVDQQSLEELVGRDTARQLWGLGLEAVDTVCDLIDEFGIDCELKRGDMSLAHTRKAAAEEAEYIEHLQTHYGFEELRYLDSEEVATLTSAQGFHGGSLNTRARHLHPLKYCLGLARAAEASGVAIFEGSRVSGFVEERAVEVRTDGGSVRCEYLVIACNGYLDALDSRLAGQIMPINNYMLATEPLSDELARRVSRDDTSMADSRFVINYWKLSADNRLLFGGGETYTRRFPRDIKGFVRPHMLRIYPELSDTAIEYGWGGTLAITLNRMPAIGRVSKGVYYAHGYSGHGVPTATFAGKILAEAIAGTAESFDVMAGVPTPRFPGGTLLRWPGLVAGMLFYAIRDRIG